MNLEPDHSDHWLLKKRKVWFCFLQKQFGLAERTLGSGIESRGTPWRGEQCDVVAEAEDGGGSRAWKGRRKPGWECAECKTEKLGFDFPGSGKLELVPEKGSGALGSLGSCG